MSACGYIRGEGVEENFSHLWLELEGFFFWTAEILGSESNVPDLRNENILDKTTTPQSQGESPVHVIGQ